MEARLTEASSTKASPTKDIPTEKVDREYQISSFHCQQGRKVTDSSQLSHAFAEGSFYHKGGHFALVHNDLGVITP